MSFGLTDEHKKIIHRIFSKHSKIDTALIFGSRARNTFEVGSDVDIVLKGNITLSIISSVKSDLEETTLPYFFDILDYAAIKEPKLIEHIDKYGKVFYVRDWAEMRLGDICDVKGGKRLPKGETLIKEKTKHPYIRIRDIVGGKIAEDLLFISDNVFEEISKYIVNEEDIIISNVGTIGRVAQIPKRLNNANLTENCVKLVNVSEDISRDFIYYFLSSGNGQSEIFSNTVGAVQPKLPIYGIGNIRMRIPPLPEQKAIAEVLSSFDDKIELLRKQNKTLEAIAEALFKHWFVDFEFPNADSKPYKSSDGKMIGSELGEIPEGWRVGILEDIIDNIVDNRGKTPPLSETGHMLLEGFNIFCEEVFPVFNYNGKQKMVRSNTYDLWFRSGHPEHLDILCATVGTLPKWCLCPKEVKFGIAQNVISLRANKDIISPYYLRDFFNSAYFKKAFNGRLITSVQPSIKVPHLLDIEIVIPEVKIVMKYHEKVCGFYEKIEKNYFQIQTLTRLRDTLLPKLMRGEVRVKKEIYNG